MYRRRLTYGILFLLITAAFPLRTQAEANPSAQLAAKELEFVLNEAGRTAVTDPERMTPDEFITALSSNVGVGYAVTDGSTAQIEVQLVAYLSDASGETRRRIEGGTMTISPGGHAAGSALPSDGIWTELTNTYYPDSTFDPELRYPDSTFDPTTGYPDSTFDGLGLEDEQVGVVFAFVPTDPAVTDVVISPMAMVLQSPDRIPLTLQLPDTVDAGTSVTVEAVVGSETEPVTDLFGVGFELRHDMRLSSNGARAGALLANGDLLESSESASGVVSYSVTRKSGAGGVSGTGTAAAFSFDVPAGVLGQVTFEIGNILAIDANGQELPIAVTTETMHVQEPFVVWPGDTDDDGGDADVVEAVTADDLFPIANCFGLTGTARNSGELDLQWAGQAAEPWGFPAGDDFCTSSVTTDPAHADATGDGRIDQNDVLVVGYNFASLRPQPAQSVTAGMHPSRTVQSTGQEISLSAPRAGSTYEVMLDVDAADSYLGVAAELQLPEGLYEIGGMTPGASIADENELLHVAELSDSGQLAVALSRKRGSVAVEPGAAEVLTLRLRAMETREQPVQIRLHSASLNRGGEGVRTISPSDVTLSSAQSVAVDDGTLGPKAFELYGNAPNPFAAATTIRYDLPASSEVAVDVYDALGRLVHSLVDGRQEAGRKEIRFEAGDLPAGVYTVRVRAADHVGTHQMVLVK